MKKIQQTSTYLLVIFDILLVIIPLFLALQWLLLSIKVTAIPSSYNIFGLLEKEVATPEGYANIRTVSWTPLLKLLGFCSDLIGALPFLLSLVFLKRLFSHYKNGEIFTHSNALIYRNLGMLYLVDAIFIKSFSQTLIILAVTMTHPPGSRYLSISFGTPQLSSIFYGVLVIIVSWVMIEASKLHDEHKLTI